MTVTEAQLRAAQSVLWPHSRQAAGYLAAHEVMRLLPELYRAMRESEPMRAEPGEIAAGYGIGGMGPRVEPTRQRKLASLPSHESIVERVAVLERRVAELERASDPMGLG